MRCVVLRRLREEHEPGDSTKNQRYRGDDVEPVFFEVVHLFSALGQWRHLLRSRVSQSGLIIQSHRMKAA